MKVLAIFTCYNRRELTRQSMELLGQNKNVTFDYVIVNDGSTDGTDEMLAAMPYEIDLINGDGGLFWNRGMYEAIEHAKKAHPDYEYYMLMNDDTKFVPGIFDEMLPLFAPDKVMVGAMCGDDGRMSYGGIKYVKGIKYKKYGPEAQDICFDTFNANCAIIPHDIFMKVSIDPFYQHSIGDFDYGTWQDESLPRMQRMKLKESRKGLPFRDWFHFLHKYFGLGTAIVRSITPYVRIILGTKTRYSGA